MQLINQIKATAKLYEDHSTIELKLIFTKEQAERESFGREIIEALNNKDKLFLEGYNACLNQTAQPKKEIEDAGS